MQANNLEAASNQEVTKAFQPRVNPRHLSCTDFSVEVLTLDLDLPHQWWVGGAIPQANVSKQSMDCPQGQICRTWWLRVHMH